MEERSRYKLIECRNWTEISLFSPYKRIHDKIVIRILKGGPNMAQTQLDLAWHALFEGRIDEADQLSQNLLEDYEVWNLRSYLAVEKREFKQALDWLSHYYDKALVENNKEKQHIALHQQAFVMRESGNLVQALKYIHKEKALLIQYFPNDVLKQSVNIYEEGYLTFRLGNVTEGEAMMKRALKLALETEDLIAQACCYRALGEMSDIQTQAQIYFERAIELFEQSGDLVGAEKVRELQQYFT